MNTNLKLVIVAVILGALSVWTWNDSVSRGDRFTRGQKLLQNLNPDEVTGITITEGDQQVTLTRGADGFSVKQHYDYPARNEAINRFLQDLLEITLDKRVGVSAELQASLGIEPMGPSSAEIVLKNASNQEMVRLRFGNEAEEAAGRYVLRMDQEESAIHLTTDAVTLNADSKSFLDNQLLNLSAAQIEYLEAPGFLLSASDGGALTVVGPPAGKVTKKTAVSGLQSTLSNLTFTEVLLADDPRVADLPFATVLTAGLKDDTGYFLSTASTGDATYLRIEGFHQIGQVEITLETPEDELKDKADLLTRADEIQDFNDFHSSWTYKISPTAAEKLALQLSDLLEDA